MAKKSKSKTKSRDKTPGARSDLYTGLLAISLGSMIAGSIFLYLDYSQYDTAKPKMPDPPKQAPAKGPGDATKGNP